MFGRRLEPLAAYLVQVEPGSESHEVVPSRVARMTGLGAFTVVRDAESIPLRRRLASSAVDTARTRSVCVSLYPKVCSKRRLSLARFCQAPPSRLIS